MRFTRFMRASTVGVALSILLALVATANNGRDFSGYFDVSDVQKQGELVQLTLHLQLFNHGNEDEKSVLVTDERDFMVERQRLRESIDRFASGGPRICTKHPHFFFGPLTPVEWAVLMYQHLDHHLRQFGV